MKFIRSIIALAALFLAGCSTGSTTFQRTVTLKIYYHPHAEDASLCSSLREVTKGPHIFSEAGFSSPAVRFKPGKEGTVTVDTYTATTVAQGMQDYSNKTPDASATWFRCTVTSINHSEAHISVENLPSKTQGNPGLTIKWEGDVELGKPTVIFEQTETLPPKS